MRDTNKIFYVGKGTTKKGYPFCRAHDPKKRNIHWQRIVARHEFFAEVVQVFDEEALAFELERELIRYFGRANLGGLLCNIEDGGQGCSGRVVSEETRRRMSISASGKERSAEHRRNLSAAHIGKRRDPAIGEAHSRRMSGAGHPNYGKQRSEETRARISLSRKGKLAGAAHPFFGLKRPEVSAAMSGGNAPWAKAVVDDADGARYETVSAAAAAAGVSTTTMCRYLSGQRTNKTKMRYA